VKAASPNCAAALIDQRLGLFRVAIVDADLVAGLNEAPRHHLAHAAKADESDFHCVSPVS
jgi:hypothetical protein